MTNQRAALQVIAVLAVVGLLIFGALTLLSEPPGDDPVPSDEPLAEVVADGGHKPLTLTEMSDAQENRFRHNSPWPFADFAMDISELQKPGRREVMVARDDAERVIFEKIQEHRLTIRLDDVRVGDVVRTLAAEFAPFDIKVYEGLPKVSDLVVFERLYLTDVTIQQVVSAMIVQSGEQVFSEVTPLGMCIGSKNACIQARLDAKEWDADVRSRVRTEPDEFLDVEYRPDLRGAHIGRVVRDIRTKTDVEVVIGPRAWAVGILFTWVDDPLPLDDALDKIARKLEARVYVKDGRAFILAN